MPLEPHFLLSFHLIIMSDGDDDGDGEGNGDGDGDSDDDGDGDDWSVLPTPSYHLIYLTTK